MLLDPFSIAALGSLQNRVAMSSMTRGFAGPNHLATPEMAAYYGRRAEDDVALILTEGTIVHLTGGAVWMGGVEGRDLPLQNGHVDDLIKSIHITYGEDVGL